MKRFIMFSLVMLFVAHQHTAAQPPPQKVITFDKLQKTIIPLPVCSQPTAQNVHIQPAVSGYTIETVGGKHSLVINKPIPAGLYVIMLVNGSTTETIQWHVLPTTLESKTIRTLANLRYRYGTRISLRSKLLAEAELPLQQCSFEYQFDNEPPQNQPYTQAWSGPYIPASTRRLRIAIVWTYPQTGERVTLWQREVGLEQTAPDITCTYPIVRHSFDAQTNSYTVQCRGIYVDFDVPFDADNSDHNNSKAIRATLDNVQADFATLDYGNSDFLLRVYRGDEPDTASRWLVSEATVKLVDGRYNEGSFPLTIQLSGLPASGTHVVGTIVVRASASIMNPKAGKQSPVCATSVLIPIDIPINTEKAAAEAAPVLITKTTTLPADVFLKRQPWLADRLKTMNFDVFYADPATVRALYNAITHYLDLAPFVKFAEQECPTTYEIKRRIKQKLQVPQSLIDEEPLECEFIRKYYSYLASYYPLTHVAMLVSKPKAGKPLELLGALALKSYGEGEQKSVDMTAPVKIYSAEETKTVVLNSSTLNGSASNSATLFEVLTKQLAALEKSVIERKVMVETQELVPLQTTSKGTKGTKGTPSGKKRR